MEKEQKRELIANYKQQKTTGGVYEIRNLQTGKRFLKADINLEAAQNRFDFSQKVNSCVQIKMREDWERFGGEAFAFAVLEEIELGAEESPRGFKDRLKKLEEHYKSLSAPELLY